jgi:predicted nucleic acid-binding protein
MIVLVDTSIWSLALRRTPHQLSSTQAKQLRKLDEIVTEGRVRLVGPVRQEILSGIRFPEQFARLQKQLRTFPDVALEIEDYEDAAQMSNACRTHGITGSPIDFLLCSAAVRRNWAIFTADRDFQLYAKHIPLTLFI